MGMRKRHYLENYLGITYFQIPMLGWPKWLLGLWRRFMCKREVHLFDEVASVDSHYLHCDACELMVHIESIETTYQSAAGGRE